MSYTHEFGIIEKIDKIRLYIDYNPEEYDCVSIKGSLIEKLSEKLADMDTYFHTVKKPKKNLAYYGVTLIPPKSLPVFKEAVDSMNSEVLKPLSEKIDEAIKEQRYMIHFGV